MNSGNFQCSEALRSRLLGCAAEVGACACGFAEVRPVDASAINAYNKWLADGSHAGMAYLEKYSDVRAHPALLLDGARSILCLAFAYMQPGGRRSALFADYALGSDYHTVLREQLAPLAAEMCEAVPGSTTRICIDTAPLRERYWAATAGVGFIGRNNQLIVPGIGSRVFLAEILWTASVRPSQSRMTETCIGCDRCVSACPGHALDGYGALDARRCLSYLTIEHRGELPEGVSLVGRRIYGCDICQDVCPHNVDVAAAPVLDAFAPREELLSLNVEAIASMTQPDFSRIFARSAIKRAKLNGLQKNIKKLINFNNDNLDA